jgi:hypothetical protein
LVIPLFLLYLGTGIKADALGIDIPASDMSVRYRTIPVPDWFPFFPYRLALASAFFSFCHPVPDCPDAGQSGILAFTNTVQRWNSVKPARSYCMW